MAKHLFSIKFINFVTDLQKYGSVAQLNRASDSGSAGHGFESHPSHFFRKFSQESPTSDSFLMMMNLIFAEKPI